MSNYREQTFRLVSETHGWGCQKCGAAFGPPSLKFNSGDPRWFRWPTCECDEEWIEARFARGRRKRQHAVEPNDGMS